MAKIVDIYEASQGKEVPHTLAVDDNGEIVATSTETGHFLKFPAGLTKTQFEKALSDHKKAVENHEVISPEELEAKEAATKKSHSLLEYYDDGADQ